MPVAFAHNHRRTGVGTTRRAVFLATCNGLFEPRYVALQAVGLLELTAAGRPFLYFPLRNHFEQNFHVRHRLGQYGAGTHMDYSATDTEALADAIVAHVGETVDYRPVETDGAARAAAMIAELI